MIDTILVVFILSGLFVFIFQMLYVVYAPTVYDAVSRGSTETILEGGYQPLPEVSAVPPMPKVKRPAPPVFA